jgi:phenylpyruvate tautomerase PptA (4-oxalocrotonate tautomerase family)
MKKVYTSRAMLEACKKQDTVSEVSSATTKAFETAEELLAACISQIGMGSYQWKLFALCGS